MKKLITLLAVLVFCAGSITSHAQAPDIKILLPETFMKIQEYGDAYFNVAIKNRGESAEYKVEYSIDGFENVHDAGTYNIAAETEKIICINDNLPKGSYIISVRVSSDGETSEASQRMAVMEKYRPQFMDDYTKIGVHLGVPIPNILKTTYLSDKKRAENSLKLLELTGIRTVRLGTATTWEVLEDPETGQLTDTNTPVDYINNIQSTSFLNVSTGNQNYGGTSKTREQIERNVGYARKRIENNFMKFKQYVELGNEPDLEKFWTGRDVYGIQYNNLARYLSLGLMDYDCDYPLIGGVTSGGTNAVPFLVNMFDQDAYKYLDGYSYHPYIKSSDVDGKYDSFTEAYEDAAKGHGGWLRKMITEIGWDSAWEGTSSTMNHEQIAVEMVKVFMKTYLHDLDLTCYYSLVNNLGLQPQNDFSVASAGVVAASKITNELNSALYIGEYPLAEGSMCAAFIKDGDPILVSWIPGDVPAEISFKNEAVVEDIYGNRLFTADKMTMDNSVYYIKGLDRDYIYETAYDVKTKAYNKIEEEYGEKFNTSVFDEARAWSARDIENNPLGMVNLHYNIGDRLIDEYIAGNTTFELSELTEALYELHVSGEKLANVYSLTADASGTISEKTITVKNAVDARRNGEKYAKQVYTEKILKFAKWFYNKAKDAETRENSVMKSGIIASCSLLSERLSGWAEKIMNFEQLDETIGILTITEPMQTEFYQSTKDTEVKYTLDNKRNKSINGEIIIVNGDGETISSPVPVSVGANEYKDIMIKVPNDYSHKEKDMYKILLMENGEILNEKWFPVTRQRAMEVSLDASQSLFDELEKVDVKLTNNTPDIVSGKVNLTAPEGWALSDGELQFSLEGFETKHITFTITEKKQVPFNMYSFGLKVEQSDGTEVFNKKVPLNFSVLVKSDTEYDIDSFSGDITDWQNTYPLYAGAPENPDDPDEWKKSDISAVTFLKYDDNYIYVLSNVYDNIFHGKNTGSNMWRNDSLQMLFDPLNNGGPTVQSDDHAFIMGCTTAGREFLKTLGSGATSANPISYENKITVIRDNSLNLTRYLVKIPLEAVTPLEPVYGNKFRMNICFNDSDVEDRNNYAQITDGLVEGGNKRNPDLYYEYTFGGFDSLGAVSPSDCRLDLNMGSDPLDFK